MRRALRGVGFATLSPSFLGAYALHDALTRGTRDPNALRDRWVGAWSGSILRVFGIRVITIGESPTRTSERGRFVVSNHRGVADILVLLRTFGGRMVSRADLSKWPFIGMAGRRLGTVFVDRSDKRSGAVTIRTIRELLREGQSVTIFPEGTTFAGDEVRAFHPGGLSAAIGTGVDIVPVGLAYSRDSQAAFLDETFMNHVSRMAAAPPSFVVVSIGAPIIARQGIRTVELAEMAREAVGREVVRARAEADKHERR